jgi:protein-S-isoprenylcysteine O-methyltransferase Ste14
MNRISWVGDLMNVLTIYLLSFCLLFAVSMIVFRRIVRRDYLRRGRLSPASAFLQALLFFIYGGFPAIYLPDDWPATHVSLFIHVTGLSCIVIGLTLLLYGMVRLGILRSLGLGSVRLEQSGLYRLSRNPQVLACTLYVIGFAILWPSWYSVGWVLLYMVMIHRMVFTEEAHLLRTHGREYEAYCMRVPRYFSL